MKLETERLILRKPQKKDWKDIVEGAGEYDIASSTETIPHPYTKKDAEWFINDSIEKWGKGSYAFFIELKTEKKVIGVMALTGISEFKSTAGTGSWVNKKYWRKGYITEAKIAVNDFAFDTLKLRRLESTVYTHNKASNATQQKMGYILEGMKRKGARSMGSGKIHDVNVYGLLKEDWKRARVKCLDSVKQLTS